MILYGSCVITSFLTGGTAAAHNSGNRTCKTVLHLFRDFYLFQLLNVEPILLAVLFFANELYNDLSVLARDCVYSDT